MVGTCLISRVHQHHQHTRQHQHLDGRPSRRKTKKQTKNTNNNNNNDKETRRTRHEESTALGRLRINRSEISARHCRTTRLSSVRGKHENDFPLEQTLARRSDNETGTRRTSASFSRATYGADGRRVARHRKPHARRTRTTGPTGSRRRRRRLSGRGAGGTPEISVSVQSDSGARPATGPERVEIRRGGADRSLLFAGTAPRRRHHGDVKTGKRRE